MAEEALNKEKMQTSETGTPQEPPEVQNSAADPAAEAGAAPAAEAGASAAGAAEAGAAAAAGTGAAAAAAAANVEELPSVEETKKTIQKLGKAEKQLKHFQWFILRLLVMLLVLWVIFFVVIGVVTMPGGDMVPRIDAGDLLLYYRLDKDVRAQDIIVIKKEGGTYVARVVAVAGDTVEVTENETLVINGNTMIESNIFYSTPPYNDYTQYPLTVPENGCFVLADQRHGGTDSRVFGTVDKSEILGTVITLMRRNNL